jgi:hypothetical protein
MTAEGFVQVGRLLLRAAPERLNTKLAKNTKKHLEKLSERALRAALLDKSFFDKSVYSFVFVSFVSFVFDRSWHSLRRGQQGQKLRLIPKLIRRTPETLVGLRNSGEVMTPL